MSKDPTAWMPLYVGDYLGDTQRLTTEQHGAYLLLILDYWRNGPAPDDDSTLQQITKLDRTRWKKHRLSLERMFQITDGEWRHRRIDTELSNAKDNAERRTSKAKAAAEARWSNAPSNAQSMPEALLVECPPPSPSPKGRKKEEEVTLLHGFVGRTIRLSERDFGEWKKRYSGLADILGEMGALDDWLQSKDEATRKNWFHVVSGALNKKHQEALRKSVDAESGECEFTGPC